MLKYLILNLYNLVITRKERLEKLALFGGIIAIFFEWLAVLLFFINYPTYFSGERPLSYFATLPQTRLIFVICLSLAAISFWIFVRWHLHKRIKTPVKVFAFSMLSYLATAVVPFNMDNGISENIHRTLTLLFSISFILGIYLIGKNNEYKSLKLFSFIVVVINCLSLFAMFFTPNKSFVLLFEMLPGLTNQIWTVGITYFTYKIKK